VDGKFLRTVDSEESDYLKEVCEIYTGQEEVIEPEFVPGVWQFLFELQECDDKDWHALVFTKKTAKRHYFKFLYVPTENLGLGYIRIGFYMVGYKTYNATHEKLAALLRECGNSINYNDLLHFTKECSGEELQNNLKILTNLKKYKDMKTQIEQLREMLKQLAPSPYSNCIAGNSHIKYIPFKGYAIFTGGINPQFLGTFEEVKERIQQEIELTLLMQDNPLTSL